MGEASQALQIVPNNLSVLRSTVSTVTLQHKLSQDPLPLDPDPGDPHVMAAWSPAGDHRAPPLLHSRSPGLAGGLAGCHPALAPALCCRMGTHHPWSSLSLPPGLGRNPHLSLAHLSPRSPLRTHHSFEGVVTI